MVPICIAGMERFGCGANVYGPPLKFLPCKMAGLLTALYWSDEHGQLHTDPYLTPVGKKMIPILLLWVKKWSHLQGQCLTGFGNAN